MYATEPLPSTQHETDTVEIDDDPFVGATGEHAYGPISLSSTVRDHVYENGRRYHAFHAGQYMLSNDGEEQKHLDTMHHICSMLFGGRLHLVELPNPVRRILDIGTGTGVWAIDIADQGRIATVIGVDLSPIQPD